MPDKLLSPSMGLLNTDLQKANADAPNVKAGLTFYAGDKTLKTGTLQDLGYEPLAAGGTLYDSKVYFYIGENAGQGRYIVQRGVYWDFASVANLIGLTADKMVSWANVLGIQGTNRGYDAGWSDGVSASRIYKETDWVFNVRDDPNLKGRPFKVRVQTNGNSNPTISIGFDNGTILWL